MKQLLVVMVNRSLCYKRIAKRLMLKCIGAFSNALTSLDIFTYRYINNTQTVFLRKVKYEGLVSHLQFLKLYFKFDI